MLTEGWDANTVTHILGVRAFGTQLLCEQVVGRGLRRMSYAAERRRPLRRPSTPRSTACRSPSSRASGSTADPKPGPLPTRVRALEDRIACEITFPRLRRLPLRACPASGSAPRSPTSRGSRSRPPTSRPGPRTRPIVGESSIHTLDDLERRRPSEVAFLLAKLALEKYFRRTASAHGPEARFDADVKRGSSRSCSAIAKRWLAECVTLQGRHVPAAAAAHRVRARRRRPHLPGDRRAPTTANAALKPILRPLRHRRLDARTSTSTPPSRSGRRDRQVPRLPRRGRHRLVGAEAGAGARRACAEVTRLREEPGPRLHDPVHAGRRASGRYLSRLHRTRRIGSDLIDRGLRRGAQGQGGEGRNRADAVGAGGQQPRRLRALGVRRGHRPVGRQRASFGERLPSGWRLHDLACHAAGESRTMAKKALQFDEIGVWSRSSSRSSRNTRRRTRRSSLSQASIKATRVHRRIRRRRHTRFEGVGRDRRWQPS